MNTAIKICLHCVLFAIAAVHADSETVILKVYVNTVDRGDYFFYITPDNSLSIGREQLLDMGLRQLPADMTGNADGVALDDLQQVQYRLDMAQSMLHIEAHPDLLAHHVVDLGRRPTETPMLLRDTTAYLNYNIRYDEFGSTSSNNSYSMPLELGLSSGTAVLSSSGSYYRTARAQRWQRHASRLIWDDPGRLNRWVAGDFSAFSGLLGGGGAYAGLNLSRRFSLQPQVRRGPGLDLTGMLWAPSEIEIYVDERLVRRERLPPGQFTLNNVPTYSGVGQTTMVIKDMLGREQRIITDFYRSAQLLAPGLHDYNHSLGFPRRNIGLSDQYALQPVYLGFHQWGITRALTAGMRAEVAASMINAGPTVAFVAGPLGEVEIALAASRTRNERGVAAHVSHYYRGAGFSTRFSLRATSRRYAHLSLTPQQNRAALQGLFGLGYHHAKLGSVALTYSQTLGYATPTLASYRLSFARRAFARSFISASLLYSDGLGSRYSADLRLTVPLGKQHSMSADRRVAANEETDTVSLRQQLPTENGLAYNTWYQRRRAQQRLVSDNTRLGLRYQASVGRYTADYERSDTLARSTLSAAGSFTVVGGVLRPSRTVRDGFALVKVGRLPGVRVYRQHQLVGRTDKRGEILVPNLISYQNNLLSMEDKDIPINYALSNTKIFASPVTKGGGVVEFNIIRLQGFVGYVYFDNGNGSAPLESTPLRIANDKRVIDTIIGFDGEFYLENLQPGNYQLSVDLAAGQCEAILSLPDSEQMMVDLGEIHCEIPE